MARDYFDDVRVLVEACLKNPGEMYAAGEALGLAPIDAEQASDTVYMAVQFAAGLVVMLAKEKREDPGVVLSEVAAFYRHVIGQQGP